MDIGGVGSVYADYMSTQVSSGKADALQNKLTNSASTATEEELMDACKEFESYFMEQVFNSMLETTKVFSDDKDENGYASKMVDYFKDYAVQELCDQATSGGGLGIANTLYEQMKRNYGIGVDMISAEDV